MLRSFSKATRAATASPSRCAMAGLSRSFASRALSAGRRPLALTTSQFQKRYNSALSTPPDPNDNFLTGNTANYIDEMYMQWKQDPKSVHVSWQVYFKNIESGEMPISKAFIPPPSLVPSSSATVPAWAPAQALAWQTART